MSVSVSNLTKVYGEQKAVDSISFTINSGEVVGFLGPNGAGKSTTMKMITGFLEVDQGVISVCGLKNSEDGLAFKKKIGYLPENNPLYYDMYIKEYLAFVASLYKVKKPMLRVAEMIEMTGLQREQGKKIGQLSKGYKQRVGIAQAMIHDPEVLILDEPTSGLDPNQLVEIRELITNLGKEKTIILSTHIMQEVEAMCKRVIILNRGKIVADDSMSNVKARSHKQTFVNFKAKGKKASNFHIDHVNFEDLDNDFIRATSSKESALNERIYNYCAENKFVLQHLEEQKNSLEDIFKQLTK